jgi:hypothetical protein
VRFITCAKCIRMAGWEPDNAATTGNEGRWVIGVG